MSQDVYFTTPHPEGGRPAKRKHAGKYSHSRMGPVFDSPVVYADKKVPANVFCTEMDWAAFKETAQRHGPRDADPNYFDFLRAISDVVARPDAAGVLVTIE